MLYGEVKFITRLDDDTFKTHYEELVVECRNFYQITKAAYYSLSLCQNEIEDLLMLLRKEIHPK